MNSNTIHNRIFLKQFFVMVLLFSVFIQPLTKTFSLITYPNSELTLLESEHNIEDEQEEDVKNEKNKIVITPFKYAFYTNCNSKVLDLLKNVINSIFIEIHLPPPDRFNIIWLYLKALTKYTHKIKNI